VTAGARRLGAGLLAIVAIGACGKRGSPLPPLRSVPARIGDLAVLRVDDRVELSWTVPAANTDGTALSTLSAVDVYAVTTTATDAPPTAEALLVKDRLVARMGVRPAGSPAGAPPNDARPAPGERARFSETIPSPLPAGADRRHYVVVPVTGERGRPDARSDVVTVPLPASALPGPPRDVTVAYTEATVTVTWQPPGAGQAVRILESRAVFDAAQATVLTGTPVSGTSFGLPVEFGRERCLALRTVVVAGPVTSESAPTTPVCVTPVDRFPPAAPVNLQAIQEAAGVTLVWSAVEAPDLAGYIVLRGDSAGENMQALVSDPVGSTSYRDLTAQPGVTYVYAVTAQDRATPPNISPLSNRQTVTVR
jgi:hypothetical protein